MVLSWIPDSGKSGMAAHGWGWTPDPRQIGGGTPTPDPRQIGGGGGGGDRGFRALLGDRDGPDSELRPPCQWPSGLAGLQVDAAAGLRAKLRLG